MDLAHVIHTDVRPVPGRPEGAMPVHWQGGTFPAEFDFERDYFNGVRIGLAIVGEPRPDVPYPVQWRNKQ